MSTQANTYISTRTAKIFFYSYGDGITFSPFLQTFSFETDIKVQEEKTSFGDQFKIQSVKKQTFDISFDVPSENWIEAKENHRKLALLIRMNLPDISDTETESSVISGVFVRFSNLIHDLDPNTSNSFNSGVLFKILNISYKPDLDLGFFDNGGILFAKSFNISLQLIKEDGLNDLKKLSRYDINKSRTDTEAGKKLKKYSPGRLFGFKTPFGEE